MLAWLVDEADFSKYRQWQKWIDWLQPELLRDGNVASLDKAFCAAVVRRTFILTKKGYIGLDPGSCRTGDLVVIIPGGKVPYILRLISYALYNTPYIIRPTSYALHPTPYA